MSIISAGILTFAFHSMIHLYVAIYWSYRIDNNHCNFRLLPLFIFHARQAYNMVNSRALILHSHQAIEVNCLLIENKMLLYTRREFRFFLLFTIWLCIFLCFPYHINRIETINSLCNSFIINTRPSEFNICQWQRA